MRKKIVVAIAIASLMLSMVPINMAPVQAQEDIEQIVEEVLRASAQELGWAYEFSGRHRVPGGAVSGDVPGCSRFLLIDVYRTPEVVTKLMRETSGQPTTFHDYPARYDNWPPFETLYWGCGRLAFEVSIKGECYGHAYQYAEVLYENALKYGLCGGFVSVSTDKPSYTLGETVDIGITVKIEGEPAEGAEVSGEVERPDGGFDILPKEAFTHVGGGEYTTSYLLEESFPGGPYRIRVRAKKDGFEGTGEGDFEVITMYTMEFWEGGVPYLSAENNYDALAGTIRITPDALFYPEDPDEVEITFKVRFFLAEGDREIEGWSSKDYTVVLKRPYLPAGATFQYEFREVKVSDILEPLSGSSTGELVKRRIFPAADSWHEILSIGSMADLRGDKACLEITIEKAEYTRKARDDDFGVVEAGTFPIKVEEEGSQKYFFGHSLHLTEIVKKGIDWKEIGDWTLLVASFYKTERMLAQFIQNGIPLFVHTGQADWYGVVMDAIGTIAGLVFGGPAGAAVGVVEKVMTGEAGIPVDEFAWRRITPLLEGLYPVRDSGTELWLDLKRTGMMVYLDRYSVVHKVILPEGFRIVFPYIRLKAYDGEVWLEGVDAEKVRGSMIVRSGGTISTLRAIADSSAGLETRWGQKLVLEGGWVGSPPHAVEGRLLIGFKHSEEYAPNVRIEPFVGLSSGRLWVEDTAEKPLKIYVSLGAEWAEKEEVSPQLIAWVWPKGTKYAIEVEENESLEVTVEEGSVEVRDANDNLVETVETGESREFTFEELQMRIRPPFSVHLLLFGVAGVAGLASVLLVFLLVTRPRPVPAVPLPYRQPPPVRPSTRPPGRPEEPLRPRGRPEEFPSRRPPGPLETLD